MTATPERTGLLALLERSMAALARRRPLFHSEADFQLALGWEIHTQHPDAQLRLEQRLLRNPTVELDVLIRLDGARFGVELKYLKARLSADVGGEHFDLATGASDVERYDVLRDVARLERLVDGGLIDAGCALALSNVAGLWRSPSAARATGYDAFRLHEGERVGGRLQWGPSAGSGTRRGREQPIDLRGRYALRWAPYARVSEQPNGELRSLAIAVGRASQAAPAAAAEPVAGPASDTVGRGEELAAAEAPHATAPAREPRDPDRTAVREYARALVEAAFERHGFDVARETDARGGVLVAVRAQTRLEVHVRIARDLNYTFLTKARFRPRSGLYACLVRLPTGAPAELYLIPSRAWESPDALLVDRAHVGLASEPEWGINLSPRTLERLQAFDFDRTLA